MTNEGEGGWMKESFTRRGAKMSAFVNYPIDFVQKASPRRPLRHPQAHIYFIKACFINVCVYRLYIYAIVIRIYSHHI